MLFLLGGLSLISLAGCKEDPKASFEIQYSVTKEPTCTEKGKEEGYDESNNLVSKDIPALGHSYDEGKITKEATCEEKGEKTYTCSRCHESKTEEIAALGHEMSDEYLHDESTHYQTCSRCGKTFNKNAHTFQFKSSTNLEPKYYFPENYYYVSDELKPTFGYDENGTEIMGAINEYECPVCKATIYKAEFITEYTDNYSRNDSYIDTGYRNEYTYVYSDYKIQSVTRKVIDNDSDGSNKNGTFYEYLYTDIAMTITRYSVSSDGNTKVPYLKAILTFDKGDHVTKVEHFYYHSSNGTWGDRYDWFEFTYSEEGKVVKVKQDYLSSFYVEVTYLEHDAYNEKFLPLKEVTYNNDGTAVFTYEYTYDNDGKCLTRVFTNHETGQISTRNYSYDSQGRLLKDGYYTYEYYDGDSYRRYSNGKLEKDIHINSSGMIDKQTDYYDTLTVIYELLSYSSNQNESIKSSKQTYDYTDDSRDYILNNYLKTTFSNGLKTHVYEKVEKKDEQSYTYSSTTESNTDYTYTNRNFISKIEVKTTVDYVNENLTDFENSRSKTYTFKEFSISKNILINQ